MEKIKLKKLEREFSIMYKKIDIINKELVILLNKIEGEYLFDPFSEIVEKDVQKLWEKVSNARNFKIYFKKHSL